jgi:glucose-specific phosphotransferase system IIA component
MEVLCSPVNGKATMLENVHDEMFSEKMLGDGIAVIPDENELRSPVEGTVTMIYETQHAIGIQTDLGTDILIHIGTPCSCTGYRFKQKQRLEIGLSREIC